MTASDDDLLVYFTGWTGAGGASLLMALTGRPVAAIIATVVFWSVTWAVVKELTLDRRCARCHGV